MLTVNKGIKKAAASAALRGIIISALRDQPGMFLHRVNRYEGDNDRHSLYIFLISRVVTVIPVLPELQSAGSAEHDIDDSDIAKERDDPHEN